MAQQLEALSPTLAEDQDPTLSTRIVLAMATPVPEDLNPSSGFLRQYAQNTHTQKISKYVFYFIFLKKDSRHKRHGKKMELRGETHQ